MGRACIACEEIKPEDEICYGGFCRRCEKDFGNVKRHPGHEREIQIRASFGLEYKDYASMYAKQGGQCMICCTKIAKYKNKDGIQTACVDHDHATGQVRGLLCKKCNLGLGYFNDDPEVLDAAVDYILRNR